MREKVSLKEGVMFSIVKIGSKQYSVTLGSRIRVEKLTAKKGSYWVSKDILAVQDKQGGFLTGAPFVDKAQIKARVVRHGKSKKILILKKKRRKGYRRTQGHRQWFTELFVENLTDSKGQWLQQAAAKKKTSSTKEDSIKKQAQKKAAPKQNSAKKTKPKEKNKTDARKLSSSKN